MKKLELNRVTFQDVLDSGKTFDASGIDNPNDWLWVFGGVGAQVYYPSQKIDENSL